LRHQQLQGVKNKSEEQRNIRLEDKRQKELKQVKDQSEE